MKTIITNVTAVTMNRNRDIIKNGFAAFEDGKIIAVDSMENMGKQVSEPETECIDGRGGLLMPGMVNLHTHMGMIPFRGLGDDCKDRLRVFLLPMEQEAMDAELVRLSTKYAAAEMLLSGVTTVFDMYYFEKEAARAMDEMGIRGFAGQTVMEDGACDFKDPKEALRYGGELMKAYENHPRISGCVAPHGTSTCSEEVLTEAYGLDQKYAVPFSLHTAEMDYEMTYFHEKFGLTPAAYLDRIGVLGERTLAAHCIRMSEEDIRLFAGRGASVAHCIASNTKAAKGVAPVGRVLEAGIAAGFGTDGPASGNTLDILTQMRFCANFQKNETRDRSAFPAKTIVEMATLLGARALGLEDVTGSIETGKRADLVLVETDSANMFPIYDPYSALVYSANPSNVSAVFVDGECLVRDKKLVRADLKELRGELEEKMGRTAFGTVGKKG